MRYRKLAETLPDVSIVGFGTWGHGGTSYGPIEEKTSLNVLQMAFDRGVNFYDTADLYGGGYSEQILAKAFTGKRDRVIYASKGGTLPHTGFVMPQDFSRGYLTSALNQSLKRLKTDYIDLYQLHSPTVEALEKYDCLQTLEMFKASGMIREYGVSVRSPQDGVVAVEKYGYKVVQVNFNLIDQRCLEYGLFEKAKTMGAHLICRTPLCFGFLSGNLDERRQFSKGDHRANWPKDQLKIWADAPSLFKELTGEGKRSYVQLALQFCLAQDAFATVIPGMMNPDEVIEDLAVVDLPPLSPQEISIVAQIYKANTFYDQTAKSRGKQ